MAVNPRVDRLERNLIRMHLTSFMGTRNRLNALLEQGASRKVSYL